MPTVSVVRFGDTEELQDGLAELVSAGAKCATTSLLASYEVTAEPLPRVGDTWDVVDAAGIPRARCRTTHVVIRPFRRVDARHAELEGEGDGSLEHWRAAHRGFFSRQASAYGVPFDNDSLVVLERFERVADQQ